MLVNQIAYILHSPSLKLRSQTADLLAALCVLSPFEGYNLVLGGISEFKVAFEERYRFEWIIASLDAYAFIGEDRAGNEDQGLWEWRCAALGLFNALCDSPNDVDDRCDIRGELHRRGFTKALEVSNNCHIERHALTTIFESF